MRLVRCAPSTPVAPSFARCRVVPSPRPLLAPIDLKPGEWVNLNLTFDRPGTYIFYCTRWCGPHHDEMRGLIVVGSG